jgi:hypothetical protein
VNTYIDAESLKFMKYLVHRFIPPPYILVTRCDKAIAPWSSFFINSSSFTLY